MSVAVLTPEDVAALVRQTIAETLAAQQPVSQSPAQVAEPGRLALTAREAADALGISQRTLWTLTAPRGSIRSTKAGSRTLYSVAELQRWLDGQSGT